MCVRGYIVNLQLLFLQGTPASMLFQTKRVHPYSWDRSIEKNNALIHLIPLKHIVVDLFDVQSNKEISLEEVMDGLRYVMEYRIKGGRYPSLDYDIMKRLADGLLMNMGNSEKKRRVRQKLTEEADVAFQLFGEFILEGMCYYPSFKSCFDMLCKNVLTHPSSFLHSPRVSPGCWRKARVGSSSLFEARCPLWKRLNCSAAAGRCGLDRLAHRHLSSVLGLERVGQERRTVRCPKIHEGACRLCHGRKDARAWWSYSRS